MLLIYEGLLLSSARWFYTLIMLGAFAFFRVAALYALVSKARHFYY